MKSKRVVVLLAMVLVLGASAAVRHALSAPHPDSRIVLKEKRPDYQPLVLNGEKQPGVVTHRMLNGLLIHLKETSDGFEPILGVYRNAEGAKVHVKDVSGIVSVHTHALIPEYDLGHATFAGVEAVLWQIPPEHYEKGPSKFLLRFKQSMREGELTGEVRHEGKILADRERAVSLNSRNQGLTFAPAFPDYPKGSVVRLRFVLGDNVSEAEFPLHELPPKETLSRTLFQEEGKAPRFE